MRDQLARDVVVLAARRWRSSKCMGYRRGHGCEGECVGDNHLEECPVELARQDLIAALDSLAIREA